MKFPEKIFVTQENDSEGNTYLLASENEVDAIEGSSQNVKSLNVGEYKLVQVNKNRRIAKSVESSK